MGIEGKKIGVVTLEYVVKEVREASIVKLDQPTKSGYPYAIIAESGEPIGFLSEDEGKFQVEHLMTSGSITGFYRD